MIIVIGGGPAGRLASIHLALEEKDVLLVDKRGALGGQCLHKGCMVICALNDVARSLDECRNLRELGIFDKVPSTDYSMIMDGMKNAQNKIAKVLDKETKDCGVEVINAEAKVSGRKVTIGDETFSPENIIIATGSTPAIPPVRGSNLPGVYTPHTITDIRELPNSIVIFGGGVIAAEYAYIFSLLGVDTEIISRSSFLRGKPEQMIRAAKKDLEGVKIRENAVVTGIEGDETVSGVEILEKGVKSRTDTNAVLIATGLVPNSNMVSGITKGNNGEILVNDRMETDIPGVYAAGDVTGQPFLTPVARLQGIIAADSILGIKKRTIPDCIPQAIRLRYEHSFCETGTENGTEVTFPAPAGPGSFWHVHKGNTGRSMLSADINRDHITGAYLGSPGSAQVMAYIAHLISKGSETSDFAEFIEVHPSTDGIPSLIKYLAQLK
ncbi:MAG: NAD(P)/FAD-dependent oxidoreductase [Methanomicrobiaceae archaeon]|nr:NAD(P)/FAD-dependent oxidoreductase [Methanomicrobiaceae archaeon]